MPVPFQLSASSGASQGDAQAQGNPEIVFSAPFAVGSGARASSEVGKPSAAFNPVTVAILAAGGLVGLVVLVRLLKK